MSGWFAMRRGIHEHPLFKKRPDRLFVWSWMLATAAWKPYRMDAGGSVITVERGQLCVTQRQIEEATGVGRQAIRRLLDDLEAETAIERKPATEKTKGKTLITICNYGKYQDAAPRKNPDENPTATQQQPINKQDNNYSVPSERGETPPPTPVSVATTAMWSAGKAYLASKGVRDPGSMIGKWMRDTGNDTIAILNALDAAHKIGTEEPVSYITKVLNGGTNAQPSKQDQRMHAFISGARGSS
ncbi:MarR family transcriptional regulator [Dinoroseobacter sp. S375]|uniref:MarR family transcriptional regulator n=1 Tax=Dinoroseobacter sp. S375 TaxID=3415136 RepID=UPI003C7D25FC